MKGETKGIPVSSRKRKVCVSRGVTKWVAIAVVGSGILHCSSAQETLRCETAQRVLSDALIEKEEYFSYLMEAIEKNNHYVAELLIQAGSDVNGRNKEGLTPLMHAAKNGSIECAVLLIEDEKLQWRAKTVTGQSVCDVAIAAGKPEIARIIATQMNRVARERLQARGCQLENLETSLLKAAEHGDDGLVELLIMAGVDVNAVDNGGETALTKVARLGDTKLLEMLLTIEDIEVNKAGKTEASTPLIAAVSSRQNECVRLLLADSRVNVRQPVFHAKETPLHRAVATGNLDIVQVVLAVAPELANVQDAEGYTPLHYAVLNGHVAVVAELLRLPGIKMEIRDKNGDTPLLLAVRNERPDVVQRFLERAHIEVGRNVLMTGMRASNIQLREMLATYMKEQAPRILKTMGVVPEQYDFMLFKSMAEHDKFMFDLLLSAGADCNAVNAEGCPLLCKAAEMDTTDFTVALLEMPGVQRFKTDSLKRTPLHVAVEANKMANLHLLLENCNGKTDVKDSNGNTPLHLAVYRGSQDAVKLLLQDPDAPILEENDLGLTVSRVAKGLQDKSIAILLQEREKQAAKERLAQLGINEADYGSALCSAAGQGLLDTLELLLLAGTDVNARDNDSYTPILRAAQNGKSEALRILLSTQGCMAHTETAERQNALHLAAAANHADCVRSLLANRSFLMHQLDLRGGSPYDVAPPGSASRKMIQEALVKDIRTSLQKRNVKEPVMEFALCEAAYNNNTRTMALCLEIGVNPNAMVQNRTALDYAIEKKSIDAIQQLLKSPKIDVNLLSGGLTPLHTAVKAGSIEIAEMLLAHEQVNVNAREKNSGDTPLHTAVSMNNNDMIRLLLSQAGVDVNLPDACGNSPLSWALEQEHEEAVQTLLEASEVSLEVYNEDGEAPIHVAVRQGLTDCVSRFIKRDARQVNFADKKGRTPLYEAVRHGQTSVLKLLLKYRNRGLDIPANNGMTPLHIAALNNRATCVEHLLAAGCKVNVYDNQQKTPIYYAAYSNSIGCVRLLLDKSADLVIPLTVANQKEHKECAKLICDYVNNKNCNK